MKNIKLIFVISLISFFSFQTLETVAQDFYKVRIGWSNYKHVKPVNIINDNSNYYGDMNSDTRFVAYQTETPTEYSPKVEIGVLKIDVSTNTTLYNVLFSFDQNQVYYSSVVDMEVFFDKLYVLISINFSDVLLVTLNKVNGSILKKEYVKINNQQLYSYFVPTDLQISIFSQSSSTPLIGILGEYKYPNSPNGSSGFSNLCLLYKYGADNTFTEVKFYNPNRWGYYHKGGKIIHLDANGASIISNDVWGGVGLTFDYNFNTQVVSSAKNYSINNIPFLFFSQATIDGIIQFYGQLSYSLTGTDYLPGQSNDVFVITPATGVNPTTLVTYNNPNFLAFKGDDHANGRDALYVNSSVLFGGYLIKSDQNISPYYGVVKIDYSTSDPNNYITGKAYQLSTKVRDFYYDPNTGVYHGFEDLYHSLTHNNGYYNSTINPGAVFERRYMYYPWTGLNYFYYANSLNSHSCNESFSFNRTFDKNLIISDDQILVEHVQTKILDEINLSDQLISSFPHTLVCEEIPTNIDGRVNNVFNKKFPATLSKTKLVDDTQLSEKEDIKIFPNPINANNEITFLSPTLMKHIEIYDMFKRKIYEKRNVNSKQVRIQIGVVMSSGTYFALVHDQSGRISVRKILKR